MRRAAVLKIPRNWTCSSHFWRIGSCRALDSVKIDSPNIFSWKLNSINLAKVCILQLLRKKTVVGINGVSGPKPQNGKTTIP